MPPPSFQVRLTSSRTLVPAVKELVFERLDGPLDFAPGQWSNFHLPVPLSSADTTGIPGVANEITRAYSIASAPVGTSSFSLAVTHVTHGPGSTALHALEPGAEIRATGPQGFFTRDADAGHPSLFVATGTGFTPLRSMLHAALHKRSHEPLWVLLGVRTAADRLYAEELEALEAQHPNLRSFFTLSRADASWTGRTGYVQTHVDSLWKELVAHSITEHQRAPSNGEAPHVYICGLERMVKAVPDKLRKELAVPRERMHSERYDSKVAYLGLPLGALLLQHDGHDLVLVGLSRTDSPGFYRAGVRFGDRLIVKPDVSDPSLIERARTGGAELLVSWFWTTLIPRALVAACPRGGIGVHPSLLPRHRGADPYFWALDRGDEVTGVSVHRIAPTYDTGEVLEQRRLVIDPEWTSWDLARALDRPSLAALRSVVARMAAGEVISEVSQDESLATQAPRPDDEMTSLHFSSTTDEILRRVRALAPAPGAWFELGESDVCLLKARRADSYPAALEAGEAAEIDGRVVVRTSDGAVELIETEIDGAPTDRDELARIVRALRGRS